MNNAILRRPFPPEQVKQRETADGKVVSYVETHVVIARLNEGCDRWSFEIVEHHVYKAEVVVVGKLLADGVVKMAFGGETITFHPGGKAVSLADDLKAAASDALKKCASMFGVGLELYVGRSGSAPKPVAAPPQNPPRTPVRPGAEPSSLEGDEPTEKQLTTIKGICRRRRLSGQHLAALIEKQTGKHQLDELTRREASLLLSELTGQNGAHP